MLNEWSDFMAKLRLETLRTSKNNSNKTIKECYEEGGITVRQ